MKRIVKDQIISYVINKTLHRIKGPAIVYFNGELDWYKKGEFHRLKHPSIFWPDGTLSWFDDGKWKRTERINSRIVND
jgi:hypothetical protein